MLHRMKAEFQQACREIEERARQVKKSQRADARAALLVGDYEKRDRIIGKLKGLGEVTLRAKTEAGVRIGEKYGLNRAEMEEAIRGLLSRQ